VAKRFYEKALAVDFDSFLNASRHERTSRRRGYRNGHRSRNLLTTVGDLDIRVPRDREGQYQPGLFEWYQRVDRSLEETVWAMFLQGVSTRKVGDVLEALCSGRLSASKVSTVVKELDLAIRDFANHRIEDNFVFLFLDALSVSIRFELSAKKVKLLVALGSALMAARSCWGFR
jgi:putative transposase